MMRAAPKWGQSARPGAALPGAEQVNRGPCSLPFANTRAPGRQSALRAVDRGVCRLGYRRRLPRRQAAQPILKIGKNFEYTQADFDRELKLSLQRVSQVQGVQVTPPMFAAFGGAQRLVDQAESKGLLQAYGEKLGIDVPQSAAIQMIESDPRLCQPDRPVRPHPL